LKKERFKLAENWQKISGSIFYKQFFIYMLIYKKFLFFLFVEKYWWVLFEKSEKNFSEKK